MLSMLQGLNDTAPDASSIEERNALALAIVPTETGEFCFWLLLKLCCLERFSGLFCLSMKFDCFVHIGTTSAFNTTAAQTKDFDPTGWELALVSTPSTDISAANERQLVGPSRDLLRLLI